MDIARSGWAGLVLLLAVGAQGAMRGATAPPALPSADQVLAQAEATAKSEHKRILLVFSASWCEPCHMLDKFLDDPQVHAVMDGSLVTAHLDVGERRGDKAHTNNPGGVEEMEKLGGGDAGYPYTVMLDAEGNWIADSKLPVDDGPGRNMGYPTTRAEIDWFMGMLKKAAPQMPAVDAKIIRDWLDQRALR